MVKARNKRIDSSGAGDAGRSSAMDGRKDDHGNADGEGHSMRMVLVAEKLVVPFLLC